MINASFIEEIIQDKLASDDMYIVDVVVNSGNRISVEIDGFNGVAISYCIEISKLIDSALDRDKEDYELQVSSAGIGQPFKVVQQYYKNIERDVEVVTLEGNKLTGVLSAVNADGFELTYEEKVKVEGKKRKEILKRVETFAFDGVKQVVDIISF